MALEEIINYIHVSEMIASSGQPEKSQFKDIAQAGYRVVINLAMPNSENVIPEEGHIVTAHKMTYIHIPVPFDAPHIEHLKTFIEIMNGVRNKKTWIHCVVNKRVSAFLFQYYRLALGLPRKEAAKVMLPNWEPNEVWQQFMELNLE